MRRVELFLLLFASTLIEAELLVFNDTTGLPTCAYQCSALYNAQYECPPAGPEQVKCFCASRFLGWTADRWVGCKEACTDGVEEDRVDAWMNTVCGGDNYQGSSDGNSTSIIGDVNTTDAANTTKGAAAQAAKARDWWKKNCAFFIIAFLAVTVPILSYAVAIPLRKWAKRQLIRHRPRSQAYMEDVGPYTSVFAPGGSRHSHLSGGVLPDPENVIYPPPPVANIRQESWEARVRDQFAPKPNETVGKKMMFWSKKP